MVRRNTVILDTQSNFLEHKFSAHLIHLTKFNRFFKLSVISGVALNNQTYYIKSQNVKLGSFEKSKEENCNLINTFGFKRHVDLCQVPIQFFSSVPLL